MNFQVEVFVNGRWRQNCYLIGSAQRNALIIDPGSDEAGIAARIEELGWRPLAILNTHAHYDHVGAVQGLKERYGIPFYLHEGDFALLRRANLYKMIFDSRKAVRIPDVDHDVAAKSDGIEIGEFELGVMYTPGHTEGSTCFRLGDCLFTGDTLMAEGGGRTDLPGGNREILTESHDRLSQMDGSLKVYGGHGPEVTLAEALAAAARQQMETAR